VNFLANTFALRSAQRSKDSGDKYRVACRMYISFIFLNKWDGIRDFSVLYYNYVVTHTAALHLP
jgi:hypothetical protein